ncbi:MAG: multicopper oxidase domain-containing protein [Chloroflexi bacterium]|nr:multicopper oxidase domain-containing protein [Chloroflexota bacterium]
MHTFHLKWMRWGLMLLVAGLLSATSLTRTQTVMAQTAPTVGIACTTGASPNPTFTLATQTGYINLPDGNTMFMWGYSAGGKGFQHPGPVLCVHQGDTVTIVLNNNAPLINDAVSITFPGQENVLANGVPAQPQFDGSNNLISLTNVAAPHGGSVTYSFVASNPGTFLYESGTEPQKQVRMGLFGALIVRPAMGANFVYNRADSQFMAAHTLSTGQVVPAEEFMVLLSEIDPYQHQAVENGQTFDMSTYQPRYWLINGRGFPDSIADNFAPFLPNQPYGALARIHAYSIAAGDNNHPYPGVARYLNVGTEDFPFHPHGNNGVVIGRDGHPLEGPAQQDLSFEKFAINIGPGQTWDVIFKWYDAENYDATTNPVPVTVPEVANQSFGQFYNGSPYLGTLGTLPPGASTLNQCGEYYIISHNHALYQITSWGVTMTGPITYMRVDPPFPNNCQP